MIQISECPVCGSKSLIPFLTCRDHSVSREIFNIVECSQCELLITTPRPHTKEMPRFYDSPSYTSHISTAKNILDKIYLGARTFTLKWKLSLIENKASNSHSKKLLDYGCGTGDFLKVAQSHGWDSTGIEPAPQARAQASKNTEIDIKSSLNEISTEQKFSTITLWHVLEHVEDLKKVFTQLVQILAENGTMFIAVPNHSSWDGEHYKQYWAGYDVPRHLWHFNPRNMRLLLDQNSLKLEKIIPMRLDAYYISLLHEKYKTNALNLPGLCKAFINGCRSNIHAGKTMKYSSLIYVVKK